MVIQNCKKPGSVDNYQIGVNRKLRDRFLCGAPVKMPFSDDYQNYPDKDVGVRKRRRGFRRQGHRVIHVGNAARYDTPPGHHSEERRASVLTPENKDRLVELFRCHMGKDEEIRADGFKAIVNCKNPFFAKRMFRIFDTDNNGTISLTEFMNSMNQFATQDTNDKLRFLFRIYDLDDDGLIDRSELSQVLRECMRENGMNFSDEQIEDLTDALFEDAHLVDKNEITFEALKAQLSRHEGLLENFSIIIDKWLVAPKKPVKPTLLQRIAACRPHYCTLPYIRNNFTYVAFVWIFLLVNLALIIHRMVVLWDHPLGFLLVIAKCCGQCLNFTSSFILVLMLRQALTWLRARGFASFLPIDQNVSLHMMCGYIIFIYGIIHTVAHLFLAGFVLLSSDLNKGKDLSYWEWMLTMKSEFGGLIPGIANVTGVVLMIIILVMVICSMPYIRKNGMFEIFYWTHLLYVPYWVLLIFHGPNYWKWFVGPAVLFILEGIGRVIRKNDKTSISSGFLLPSKVTHLVVKRPPNMYFAPGDYLFVNIPVIAKYEWHPFTISSAPEQLDSIWLHIRGVGEWTNRLYDYFKEQQEQIQATDAKVRNGSLYNQVVRKALPLRKKSTKTPERALQSIKR
ncbi:unnamed protein product [Cyprideis torosa]|uniref:Uncharacterized protein n=1 Tax=Cyprideis torosa TaxID=163714 RepID=A0A7R8ZQS5_9CRUS|nr:unnamed protein product [Cyprideis torosa]CAG0902076.1 unnamed protein product [Cyprideis torosa]